MNPWFLAALFFGSILASAVVVGLSIRYAENIGYVDAPDGERKQQVRPIPKSGGLAVALVFTIAALVTLLFMGPSSHRDDAVSILLAALFAAALGFADDRQPLSPGIRLAAQAAIAALIWVGGSRITVTHVYWLDFALTVVWVLAIVNGLNLLDNSDGLAGSTAAVTSGAATVIAILAGQYWIAPFGAAVCGVSLGFLLHNWFPARVYLGDAGAYFLGVLLAVLVIRLQPSEVNDLVGVLVAVSLVALPLLDTSFVVVRRLRRGVHPFTAGRDHLSHEVQNRGASIPLSVALLQLISIGGAVVAVLLVLLGHRT